MTEVILVDENDRELGTEEKIKAHREGKLHRAFSIFIFNSRGELLLQKRAKNKYHSGGLWTNTCCSHPKPGENLKDAAHRRLKEEMGFDCKLRKIFSFIYRTEFGNGLTENEFDHVLIGKFDSKPEPNKEEVDSWKWVSMEDLKGDIKRNPEKYSFWLRACIGKLISHIENQK